MIFHDAERLEDLFRALGEKFPEDSYVVPTMPHDPTPANENWDELLEKLSRLGVTNVIVAGMNLTIKWPDDENPRVAGCIADAAHELSKKFNVTISKFTYPNTKEDYNEFHGPKSPEDHKTF